MKKTVLFLLVCFLPFILSCGGSSSGGSTPVADATNGAVLQNMDQIGALMASKSGEVFMPMVSRDTSGNATGATGAQWTGADGSTVTLYFDTTTGLPTKVVSGDYIYLFSNWDTSATAPTVDVAVIYSPTNFIQVFKGVDLNHDNIVANLQSLQSLSANLALPGKSVGADKAFCFPACGTDTQNLAGLIKVAGLSFSVAACGLGIAATGGALAPALVVPCGSLLISTALLVTGDEVWMGSVSATSTVLSARSVVTCSVSPEECIAAVLETGSNMVLGSDSTIAENTGHVTTADTFLADPARASGYSTGTAPTGCVTEASYQCTAGSYLPCYTGGSKKCGADCTWGSCPNSGGGDVATLAGNYTGSYSGSCTSSDGTAPQNGGVTLTIASSGAIGVNPSGSGTVNPLGGSTFGSGSAGGATYSFSGSFVLVGSTGAVGSGGWTATATDATCSGTWSVAR